MTSVPTSRSEALADARAELARLRSALGVGNQATRQDLPDSYDEALARAALCGSFALDRLTEFAPETERLALRSALSRVSETVRATPPRLHSLMRDQREATLARLLLDPVPLRERLARDPLPPSDGVGSALRGLLRAKIGDTTAPEIERLDAAPLEDLMIAAGWLEPLGAPVAPIAVRTELASRSVDDRIADLLPNGLVGRDGLLDRIEAFALTEPMLGSGIFVIDGIGGIGKSALVAGAIQRLRRRRYPVIHFDLDRPALDPRTVGLTLEFLRQLALLAPVQAEELKRIRQQIRQSFERAASDRGEDLSPSKFLSEEEAAYLIRDIVVAAGLGTRPLCVFIDTFEAAIARGEATVEMTRDWIHSARRLFGAEELRVVVAGRAAADAADALGASAVEWIPDLPLPEAAELLRRRGVEGSAAERLAEVFGGNPLVLRLVARFLHSNPSVSINDLTAPGGVPEADAEIVQGVLYQRILGHVGAGEAAPLRRIAYPGLALRVVTPALIREVVGPVLEIELAGSAAEDLWKRLVEQAWLVSRRGAEVAEHRRDLRRMMVRVMARDEANAATLAELHRRAAAYHEAGRDRHLTPDEARHEAMYHRLMLLEPGEDLELGGPNAISLAVGNDIDDLPPPARALVNFRLSGARITGKDAALLPERLARPWSVREGWLLLDEDKADEAMRLAVDLRGRVNAGRPPVWELTAIHRTAGWDDPSVGSRIAAAEATFLAMAPAGKTLPPELDPIDDQRESGEDGIAASFLLRFERGEG